MTTVFGMEKEALSCGLSLLSAVFPFMSLLKHPVVCVVKVVLVLPVCFSLSQRRYGYMWYIRSVHLSLTVNLKPHFRECT